MDANIGLSSLFSDYNNIKDHPSILSWLHLNATSFDKEPRKNKKQ